MSKQKLSTFSLTTEDIELLERLKVKIAADNGKTTATGVVRIALRELAKTA